MDIEQAQNKEMKSEAQDSSCTSTPQSKSKPWRKRNIALLAVFVLFVSGMLLVHGLSSIGVPFPGWTNVGQSRSIMEGRTYQAPPAPNPDDMVAGSFQKKADKWAADRVPFRDAAIYLHALLQRVSIAESSWLAGFDVYPTFYGSKVLYSKTYDSLHDMPEKITDVKVEKLTRALKLYDEFAEKYPQLHFVIASAPRCGFISYGPTSNLVSNTFDSAYVTKNFLEKLGDSYDVVDVYPESFEEFYEAYYRTDHHWNIKGAYKAYCILAAALGYGDELVEVKGSIDFEQYDFHGSLARRGLMLDTSPDEVFDYVFDLPQYEVTANGEYLGNFDSLESLKKYEDGSADHRLFANHYEQVFHRNFGEIAITNPSNTQGKTLLLIGDSYSNTIERLFASSYYQVYKFDTRYLDSSSIDLSAMIQNVDDVLIFLSSDVMFGNETFAFIQELIDIAE